MSTPRVEAIVRYTLGTAKKEHVLRLPCEPKDLTQGLFEFHWPDLPDNARNITVQSVWEGGDTLLSPNVVAVQMLAGE